jgi:hypothetical protein
MSPADDLARLKSRFAEIERENADRMSLIAKRSATAMAESKDVGDTLRRQSAEAVTSLVEHNKRVKAAGGWATESALTDKVDGDFGFEDDEAEKERRAGFAVAKPVSPGRHRPREDQVEEDDYANTDWLEV